MTKFKLTMEPPGKLTGKSQNYTRSSVGKLSGRPLAQTRQARARKDIKALHKEIRNFFKCGEPMPDVVAHDKLTRIFTEHDITTDVEFQKDAREDLARWLVRHRENHTSAGPV
jgi:hypothetical protein